MSVILCGSYDGTVTAIDPVSSAAALPTQSLGVDVSRPSGSIDLNGACEAVVSISGVSSHPRRYDHHGCRPAACDAASTVTLAAASGGTVTVLGMAVTSDGPPHAVTAPTTPPPQQAQAEEAPPPLPSQPDASQSRDAHHLVHPAGVTVYSLAVSPKAQWLASAGSDGLCRVWDLLSGQEIAALSTARANAEGANPTSSEVKCVCFGQACDALYLAAGCADGTALIWRLRQTASVVRVKLSFQMKGHDKVLIAAVFGPRSEWLATAGFDRSVLISCVRTGALLCSARTAGGTFPWALAVSALGVVMVGNHNGSIEAWTVNPTRDGNDTATPAIPQEAILERAFAIDTAHDGPIYAISVSRSGKWVATGGEDGVVRFWTTGSSGDGQPLRLLGAYHHHVAAVTTVQLSPTPYWSPKSQRGVPRATLEATLVAARRANHRAALPRLPPELWLLTFAFLSNWDWLRSEAADLAAVAL
eukprot:m.160542 g.160542  ORF g.160542 m.160542 type:complete len:474 (+) comp23795_c0_seq1:405-1826(+)